MHMRQMQPNTPAGRQISVNVIVENSPDIGSANVHNQQLLEQTTFHYKFCDTRLVV